MKTLRSIPFLLAFALSPVVYGQSCTVTQLLDSSSAMFLSAATLNTDHGLTVVGSSLYNSGYASKIALDGTLEWARVLDPTDPTVILSPRQVVALPNGGTLVFGVRYDGHHSPNGYMTVDYENYFGIELDASGGIVWARIYMYPTAGHDGFREPKIVRRPSGRFLVLLGSDQGAMVAELDSTGMPLDAHRYRTSLLPYDSYLTNGGTDILLNSDGSFFVSGISYGSVWLMKADSAAQPIWSYRYDLGSIRDAYITPAQNGDVLLATTLSSPIRALLARFDANGQFLWARSYDADVARKVDEMSNGDVLLSSNHEQVRDLVLLDAAGVPLSAYESDQGPSGGFLFSTSNDSIFSVSRHNTGLGTRLVIAESFAMATCAFVPKAINTLNSWSTTTVTDTLVVLDDTLKTWTLSIADPVSYTDLDLIVLASSTPVRPGFEHTHVFSILNSTGADAGPGEFRMVKDPAETLTFGYPAPSAISGDTIIWSNLPAFNGEGAIHLSAKFSLPPNIGLIGQTLVHTLSYTQDSTETSLLNNTITHDNVVVASWDPNDKLVEPSGVYEIGTDSLLHYTIRFQNTGSIYAEDVVLVDTLPTYVSVTSFREGVASHPYTYDLRADGLLTFTFNNIMLPDSTTDEPGSHGLVSFTVRPREGVVIGTPISNSADIYFDFNPSVRTEPAVVWYGMIVSVPLLEQAEELHVYPVPVRDDLRIEVPAGFKADRMQVIDMQGRLVYDHGVTGYETLLVLPTHALPIGVYNLVLTERSGRRAGVRFIKDN